MRRMPSTMSTPCAARVPEANSAFFPVLAAAQRRKCAPTQSLHAESQTKCLRGIASTSWLKATMSSVSAT